MNLKTSFFILLFFILLVPEAFLPAAGFCFDITAQVDRTRISKDDSIMLSVEVNGGKADLDLSMIKDFKVISRGTSSSYNYSNGKSERKASYSFVLIPLKKGDLNIPAIKAVQKGRIAWSLPIHIQVSDQKITTDTVRALFAKADVTKRGLFVGEQAVYSLKFYTSKRLSGLGFEKSPEFNGFSSKPFEKQKNYTQTINGILYNVTQVDYMIIPENSGAFTIDPAVLIANVVVKSKLDPGFDSFFNDSFFSSNSYKPMRVASNPIKINVIPVPLYQGQGKFSGLVGHFDIAANIDKTRFQSGESATFSLKISGSGNIMDASLPEIRLDKDAFKVYDDNPVENIHLTQKGFEGFKLFKKAIVPVHPGKYLIPPVCLVYFDVGEKAYKTVLTDPITLHITPSEKMQVVTNTINPMQKKLFDKKEVSLINKDILEIKENLDALEDYREINPLFFVLMLSIPAILFSGVKLFTLVIKREISIERQMEEKARLHLKQARKMGSRDSRFLGHLYSSLVALILAKGGKKGEIVTIEEARDILTKANVEDVKIDQITELVGAIESIRFGGRKIDEKMAGQLLSKTKKALNLFCAAMIFLGLISFVPQKAMAGPGPAATFVDGIKNYKAGHFKRAAKDFESIAKKNIKNPYLFYNIANAYMKANDIGLAILWYERAKRMAPNDPDLKFNLDYARTLVKDKKEGGVNIMDILFFWNNFVSPKTIQITAVFFSFVFFLWAAVQVIRKRKIFSGTGIFLCALFVLMTTISGMNYYKQSARVSAVIVQKKVAVRSGMTDTSTKLFTLHAGTMVTVEETRPTHIKILFSKDRVGWIKKMEAGII